MQDPQAASRALVDHALARFSTDNLSCMVVRFDSKLLQQTVADTAAAIGVEGDPATNSAGISEAEAIVRQSQKALDESGGKLDKIPSDPSQFIIQEQEEHEKMDPGPELNAAALEAAKKT